MRHVIVGLGSIGQRHLRNLKTLRPDDEFVTVDVNGKADYPELDYTLEDIIDGSLVYICSPYEHHRTHFYAAYGFGAKGIFVEKPLFAPGICQPISGSYECPIAVGYNHRWHPFFRQLKSSSASIAYLHLYGSEDLSSKYGPTALGTMASHSIDLGLWLLGDALNSNVLDYGGLSLVGIRHQSGAATHICASMNSPFRIATCTVMRASPEDIHKLLEGKPGIQLDEPVQIEHRFVLPDNQMYIDEMVAWLNYVDTGDPGDLCTFEQALKVQEIMRGNNG